ncbi:MAG: 3-phosphoshikimate 1-carboxyvinyltransferase [Chitinophagaceae bacterium]|jgi:3-phosphoshikimate 1-carboxyvinyltransferase|nr:3-phosphoshikimate 1-carboxyvinyltransferase [Chitinophagaceae bacterium]MBK7679159.1 3-phosphoshikimate 1-carboxyvinyltransferase [Chitinophagaceae bacterium]MBK8299500.1 3-phosphoshikimate 1-carboxyvinyltransferase [Chitinophagaceae bacterium]MBK9659332.1 3-phosphoshikimate 1-carboxyvinyltransferase [Chitinophagaceae bacterium]MBK9937144.1 3-phosphoshikimate 1-carboxyvinyltransferase [Chitinophagaceae bacterium]
MKVTIHPSKLKGVVQAPASKSSMQRALAAAFLTKETCSLFNPGHSDDDIVAMGIIRALGAKVEMRDNNQVIVERGNDEKKDEINCGESGLSIRMFVPIIALNKKSIIVNGEGSLLSRPMDFFDEVLPQLGVRIKSDNGKLPLVIQGPLQPKNIEIDGSLSSQFLTGLLMAYAAANTRNISIKVKNLKSKPYIDLTLDVMKQFGLKVPENKNYEEFCFDDSTHNSQLTTHNYFVEGDWSGGAFLLVAGAIAGPVTIRGLDLSSVQADKAIVDALMSANAAIAIEAKGIKIRPAEMNAFDFDATDCPDLFPPLVALAAYCKGETTIKGVSRLTHKESNRALTLQEEFAKMGVHIYLRDDWMIIQGSERVKGAKVHSRHDHRIAMACAVAALKAEGDTIIEEAGAVKKSYPDFYNDLKSLNASVSLPYQQFNL